MADETVTIGERVATACHASNLRVHLDSNRGSQADVLMALAWSQSRLGSALMRLHSEYDAIEKPRPLSHDAMVRLALTMKSDAKDAKERIKEMQQKAKIEAATWAANEKTLFMGKLKTLPAIVDQVTMQCEKWRITEPRKVATVTIGHWLNQICPACNGLRFELIPDSPALSAKQCKPCSGAGVSSVPYGQAGRKVLNHMDDCVSRAQTSIKARLKVNHG